MATKPDYGIPWVDVGPTTNVSHPALVRPITLWIPERLFARVCKYTDASLRSQLAEKIILRNQIRYGVYDRTIARRNPESSPLSRQERAFHYRGHIAQNAEARAHQSFLDDSSAFTAAFETSASKHLGRGRGSWTPNVRADVLKFTGVPGTNLITPDEDQVFSGTSAPSSIVRFVAIPRRYTRPTRF